jgi:hypothetical protein
MVLAFSFTKKCQHPLFSFSLLSGNNNSYIYKCNSVGNIFRSLYSNLKTILYFCVVKLLTLLFAFYILFLPCISCSDKEEFINDSQTQITQSPGNQHENEACTPFCTCACCGQILVLNLQFNKTIIDKTLHRQLLQYYYSSIILPSDYFGNIWQPPKSNV